MTRSRDRDGRVVGVRLTEEGAAFEGQAAEVQHGVADCTHLDANELAGLRIDLHSLVEAMRRTIILTREGELP